MVTKSQAIEASNNSVDLHYGNCIRTVGPRGGITVEIEHWRPNGKCKTWKTRPDEFKLPIKSGMYRYGYLTHLNLAEFHLASECLLLMR